MRYLLLAVIAATLLPACSSQLERNALPESLSTQAHIPDMPRVRYWADASAPWNELEGKSESQLRQQLPGVFGKKHFYLAISGGGPRGAYTAGILNGWSEAGDRPEFTVVTGVSTGALIAPFAYLGSSYDSVIKKFYTEFSTSDLVTPRGAVEGLLSDAAADSGPLAAQIERFMTAKVMAEIAREYRTGRFLTIVTTNLDARRPVAWDIGAIADSGAPGALDLIRQVMLASASLPGGFPPVMIEVEADGQRYDELHVDGGVTSVVHLYPIDYDAGEMAATLQVPEPPTIYLIRNGKLQPVWGEVDRSTLDVLVKSTGALMDSVVLGDLYRIFLASLRDGSRFQMTAIPESFEHPENEPFDREYMRALFKLGYDKAVAGYQWDDAPPGFDVDAPARGSE